MGYSPILGERIKAMAKTVWDTGTLVGVMQNGAGQTYALIYITEGKYAGELGQVRIADPLYRKDGTPRKCWKGAQNAA